ncbi:hypothetical protein [uncultured Aquimarina sp.]|uniref:hypothetical protein n=1 Tax=uncultured Aquimarina sp. TaxID=575652 RepID=UPI00261B5265|nr:hypothetical protein [uncultured Aquimarina sp.]
MKYTITKEDLNKRSYGISFDSLHYDFLLFIQKEKENNNPFLSDTNILKLEKHAKKDINISIYLFGVLGFLAMLYGLYVFFSFDPRVAINLYTQFPFIENGSIPIVAGFTLMIGCLYSYIKREEILISKVKSKIIEHLKKLKEEKSSKNSLYNTKKRKNSNQQPKKKRHRKK